MLDMKTVMISYVISNVLVTVFIALLWRQNRKQYAGLALWLVDYLLQAFGLGLNALREVMPAIVAFILANTLIVGGLFILYVGLERFVGKPRSQVHNYVLLVGFVGLMAYFAFIQPDLSIRTDIISAAILLLAAQCSVLLLCRVDPQLKPVTCYVGFIFVGYALAALARIIFIRLDPLSPTGNWFQAPGGQTLVMLVFQMLNIALTFALILMVTRRLWLDEQAQRAVAKTLRGLVPICSSCKKIRDDEGYWHQVEEYVHEHSEAQFSHGLCPDCIRKLYPEYAESILKGGNSPEAGLSEQDKTSS